MGTVEFMQLRIDAQAKEIERLNGELRKVKETALKVRLSDPNFDKPLSEIEVDYELIKKIGQSYEFRIME